MLTSYGHIKKQNKITEKPLQLLLYYTQYIFTGSLCVVQGNNVEDFVLRRDLFQ